MDPAQAKGGTLMRFIGYEETTPGYGFSLMKDCLEKEPHPHKERIVRFLLRGGAVEFARVSRAKDVFTGKHIPYEVLVRSDGDYFWATTLAWYVEQYNLRLPEDFERYILARMQRGH